MTDRDAILNAIIADPDEDVPRLAFADCIQEDEPERAEFIRLACELARELVDPRMDVAKHIRSLIFAGYTEESDAVRKWRETERKQARERELIPGDRLYYGTGDYDYVCVTPADFRRGFVESLTLPAADWLAHADAILAAHPVQQVTLTTLPRVHSEYDREGGAVLFRLVGRDTYFPVPEAQAQPYNTDGPYRRGMVMQLLKDDPAWKRVKTWTLAEERSVWAGTVGNMLNREMLARYMTEPNDYLRGMLAPIDWENLVPLPEPDDQVDALSMAYRVMMDRQPR